MDKYLKVAVLLTAADQMSGVISNAANKSLSAMQNMQQKMMHNFTSGFALFESGKSIASAATTPFIDAAMGVSQARADLRQMLENSAGQVNESLYDQLSARAEQLSNQFGATQESYLDMMRVMKENSLDPADALGKMGTDMGRLSRIFNSSPADAGLFMARMSRDMNMPQSEMSAMLDTLARLKGIGMGMTGPEAIHNITEYFGKMGLSLQNLGLGGLEAGKEMATLGSIFMRTGLTGELVGNNLRRMFDALRDKGKMEKANAIAAQFGKHLEFFKDGKFVGAEGFIEQLTKLQGLKPENIAAIMKPLGGGRQGMGQDFLEFLSNKGLDKYKEIMDAANGQGSLQSKDHEVADSNINRLAQYRQKIQNLKIDVGNTLMPMMLKFWTLLGDISEGFSRFAKAHPGIIQLASGLGVLLGTFLMIGGAIRIMSAAWMGFKILGIIYNSSVFGVVLTTVADGFRLLRMGIVKIIPTVLEFTAALLTNPITWIVVGIVALGVAIYELWNHWDSVTKWFVKAGNWLWTEIKTFFGYIWKLFTDFTPMGILISHFQEIVTFVEGLGKKMWDAGKNLILQLWQGIKSMVMWPIREVEALWGKLENIFSGKHSASYTATVSAVPTSFGGGILTPKLATGVGTNNYHFAPVINVKGGATKEDAKMVAENLKPHFEAWMRERDREKRRTSFTG